MNHIEESIPILFSTPIGKTSVSRVMAASNPEGVIRAWTAAYTEEVADFAPPDQVTTLIHEIHEMSPDVADRYIGE